MDGTLVATNGECKAGMDIAYDGTWGYHPLIISLAETGEVLRVLNRPGNRPSHDQAATQVNRAIWLCLQAGFRSTVLRGDTDFSQTQHLDLWAGLPGVTFVFGYDAKSNLIELAEGLPTQGNCTHLPRKSRRTCSRNVSSQPAFSRLFLMPILAVAFFNMANAILRTTDMFSGGCPSRRRWSSSRNATSRTQWHSFSMLPCRR